jgi:hypothetical protein
MTQGVSDMSQRDNLKGFSLNYIRYYVRNIINNNSLNTVPNTETPDAGPSNTSSRTGNAGEWKLVNLNSRHGIS